MCRYAYLHVSGTQNVDMIFDYVVHIACRWVARLGSSRLALVFTKPHSFFIWAAESTTIFTSESTILLCTSKNLTISILKSSTEGRSLLGKWAMRASKGIRYSWWLTQTWMSTTLLVPSIRIGFPSRILSLSFSSPSHSRWTPLMSKAGPLAATSCGESRYFLFRGILPQEKLSTKSAAIKRAKCAQYMPLKVFHTRICKVSMVLTCNY